MTTTAIWMKVLLWDMKAIVAFLLAAAFWHIGSASQAISDPDVVFLLAMVT